MFVTTIKSLQVLLILLLIDQRILQITSTKIPQSKNQPQSQNQQQQIIQQKSSVQSAQPQGQHHHQSQQHQSQVQQQQQQQPTAQQLHPQPTEAQVQYVHDKEPMLDLAKNANNEEDFPDPYRYLNEMKHEPRIPSTIFPWSPYATAHAAGAVPPPPPLPPMLSQFTSSNLPHHPYPFENMITSLHTPKYLPFLSYTQPFFMPYPFYLPSPEMVYPAFSAGLNNDIEDTMSRAANGRRPMSSSSSNHAYQQRNSPIYYVRLPPMPYMFLPGLGYTSPSPSNTFGAGISSILPYQTVAPYPTFSPVFNLPINFLANGKPNGIYQMNGGTVNDIQNPLHYNDGNNFGSRPFGSRTPPPPPPPAQAIQSSPINIYRPTSSSSAGNYYPQPPYGFSAPSPPPPQQDSKMTSLKRPFVFNGRPEDIYILPNNFNPLYSDNGYY